MARRSPASHKLGHPTRQASLEAHGRKPATMLMGSHLLGARRPAHTTRSELQRDLPGGALQMRTSSLAGRVVPLHLQWKDSRQPRSAQCDATPSLEQSPFFH